MQLRTKNTLIIIGTLLMGILIGFLVSGRLTKMRMESMRQNFMQGNGMERHLMRVLDPSEEQLLDVAPIFDKYSEIMRNQMFDHQIEREKVFEDFQNELRPYLNQQQMDRLQNIKGEHNRRFQNMQHNNMQKGRQNFGGQKRGGRNK